MVISNRLKVIADMVDTNKVYDIGCDHAYLDIYLAKYKNVNCVAMDISEEVIINASKNVKNENLDSKIEVKLNNGLEGIQVDSDATIILSGLGTNNILKIINNKKINNIIIQSNDNIALLRYEMNKKGFIVDDEKMVLDGKYYTIIKFRKGKIHYSDLEIKLGPILIQKKDEIFISYLKKEELYYSNLINNIPKRYFKRRHEFKKILKYIKMTLYK